MLHDRRIPLILFRQRLRAVLTQAETMAEPIPANLKGTKRLIFSATLRLTQLRHDRNLRAA